MSAAIVSPDEIREETCVATHYRFVRSDGKATRWARVPKHGIAGPQYARARRDLGENFRLETNDDRQ